MKQLSLLGNPHTTKRCTRCGEVKPESEFSKNEKIKDKLGSWCKQCQSEYAKRYYQENKEKFREIQIRWQKNNPEKHKKVRRKSDRKYRENNPEKEKERSRKYRENNPEKRRESCRKYRKNNLKKVKETERKSNKKRRSIPKNRLNDRISSAINRSLKGNKNNKHWENLVGYTLRDLMAHLENQFKPGMNWENYGRWHLDHIKPIASFNFNSYKDKEFKECWTLENLQPLWASENLSKGDTH